MNRVLSALTLTGTFVAATCLHAMPLPFVDDFEDGSATDGTPGTWVQAGNPSATQSVIDGSLVIASAGANSPARLDATFPADISVLTQVRFLASDNGSDAAALEVRNGGEGFLIALLSAEGDLTIGSVVPMVGLNVLATGVAPVDPVANETFLQFDTFGAELALTAWEAGTPQPAPQVTVTSDDLLGTAGGIAAGIAVPSGQPATVAFRFVQVVPEPSAVLLATCCLLAAGRREACRGSVGKERA